MARLCDLFNRYRDDRLAADQMEQFKSHLHTCQECRARLYLIDNLVHAVRDQDIPSPSLSPAIIASRAYEARSAWDVLLLSWVKPLPAWAGVAALLILLTIFWTVPVGRQIGDYESLQIETSQARGTATNLSDAAIENWLEQGGAIQ